MVSSIKNEHSCPDPEILDFLKRYEISKHTLDVQEFDAVRDKYIVAIDSVFLLTLLGCYEELKRNAQ